MYVLCLCWKTDHFPSEDHHPHGDVNSYFGLMHCRISPPQGLYHTVLPYRTGGKFLFPLCRTCAEENSNDQFLYSSGFGKKVNRNFGDQWSTQRIGIRIYHMITFVWHLIKAGRASPLLRYRQHHLSTRRRRILPSNLQQSRGVDGRVGCRSHFIIHVRRS